MTEADHHWRVLESRFTYQDRWLKLRTDRCETPTGKILEGFHVIELPDWVNVIPVDADLNVILALEYRHGAGRRVLGLPSGILEKSDPSPLLGAQRELQEETGYGGGRFYSLGSAAPNPAIQSNRAHSFLAVGLQQSLERHLDPSEDVEIIRVGFSEFITRTLTGQLDLQSIHLAATHLALGFILSTADPDPALQELQRISHGIVANLRPRL